MVSYLVVYVYVAVLFSQSVAFLFILLSVSSDEQKFILM